mgnify:CR=1 FL=1
MTMDPEYQLYQQDWPEDAFSHCALCEHWTAAHDLQRIELDERGNWHLVCRGCLEHLAET